MPHRRVGPPRFRAADTRRPARTGTPAAVVALISGGADSAVLLRWLGRRFAAVFPVYVRFGLSWERAERAALRRFLRAARLPRVRPLTVVEMPVAGSYGRHWSVTGRGVPGARSDDRRMYLPGRNLMLLARGAIVCDARRAGWIALGTLGANPFGDATPRFRRMMGRVATLALRRRVDVIAPFARAGKSAVLRAGRGLPLHLTLSCVAPAAGRHCGRCNKCAERRRAFAAAGIEDRTRYG
ncbi:MAG: 7-cyano-7-deazaguanine synthase [bacterium]